MSAAVHMQQQQASIMRGPGGSKPYSLFVMSPERVLGLKRAAEPFLTYEEGGEQRLAKTPKTKSRPEPEDDEEDEGGMRYPLRSRTPLSGMKNLGLYIPPPARAAAAAVTTANTITNTNTNMNMNTLKAAASIPAPRPRANNVENDAPATNTAAATTTALALPKPITAAAAADKPPAAPLAAICRTAVSSWKRKEGADKPVSSTTSSSSSSRRGSRSRGGRGRSSSVRVVVVPVNR